MDKNSFSQIEVEEGTIAIWWLGQAGFLLQFPPRTFLAVDPYLSNSCESIYGMKRLVNAPIEPENLPVSWVLCTHEHEDHTDIETISRIVRRNTVKFIAPPASILRIQQTAMSEDRLIPINRNEEIALNGIVVRAVYAKHTEDSVGYLLSNPNLVTYVTGDTQFFLPGRGGIVPDTKVDVLIICINGKAGNMGIDDAVRFTSEIKPDVAIPCHYGMFKENTADPEVFLKHTYAVVPRVRVEILQVGTAYVHRRGCVG